MSTISDTVPYPVYLGGPVANATSPLTITASGDFSRGGHG